MEINKDNYKDWLVRYFEDDLNTAEKIEAEQFISDNEWASQELELLRRTKLKPNMEIRFPDKRLLFRTEEPVVELKRPVPVFKMYRYAALAAAAALLALAIIFSVRKPGNRKETAHSDFKKEKLPSAKTPEQVKTIAPNHPEPVLANEIKSVRPEKGNRGKAESVKRIPLANNLTRKTEPKAVQNQISEPKPIQNEPVASQLTPKAAEVQPGKTISTATPTQELAVVKPPVAHAVNTVPAKTVSNTEYEDPTLLQSLFSLLHKVSIKKEEVNKQTYYALSIETPNIKVNKTIKSIIQ